MEKTNLLSDFMNFVSKRLGYANQHSEKRPELQEAEKQHQQIMQELAQLLPPEKQVIFIKLNYATMEREHWLLQDAYTQGFIDGQELQSTIRNTIRKR